MPNCFGTQNNGNVIPYAVYTRLGARVCCRPATLREHHVHPSQPPRPPAGPATLWLPAAGSNSRTAPDPSWPLNIGQVYTTLDRLERDGLVRKDGGRRRRPRHLQHHRRGACRGPQLVHVAGAAEQPSAERTGHQARPRPDASRRRRRRHHPRPARRLHPGPAGLHQSPARHGRRTSGRRTPPGSWCWIRSSSRPKPRCAGWTSARPA